MKRKLFSALLVATTILSACNQANKQYTYDYTYFAGICALSGEFNGGVDKALTHEWNKKAVKAINAKSCRIWISLASLFIVEENDELSINRKNYNIMKDYVEKLKEGGVENFLILYSSFLHPSGYIPSTGYVVPDPHEEYDYYVRFLNLQAKASKIIKQEFPEINNFEPANEPDFACPGCVHKNGFIFGGDMSVNGDFVYNDDDKASILLDLCWYVRKAIREVDETAKLVFPGLTNQVTVPEFLNIVYSKVESRRLPVNQEFSDTDPDHYFDVLNWHPYPTKFDTEGNVVWSEWVKYNNEVYAVAKRHNDEGKEVYFSELGWTDFGSREEYTLNQIAENYTTAINLVRNELPFVTVVFAFRLTNLIHQKIDETGGEENFGLFYNPDDPLTPEKPKPAAYAVAKAFNGDDYNLDDYFS